MKKTTQIHSILITGLLLASVFSGYATETDERIETSAHKSYVFKTYLKNDDIKAESKNGAVTLSGSVADRSHRSLAQDTVESLPGVRSVDNQLKLKPNSPTDQSDSWINVQVTTTLLFHRNVRGITTDVNVSNGIVTLRGEASSQAQKDLTTEYARDIEGVKEVKNEMTIVKDPSKPIETMGEKIDDASITSQVKWALMTHRSTSLLKTKVNTLDGVVTLSGKAKNAAEKTLATKLVNDINGVSGVSNNMTVE
jgi:osmotically-inducible protein OsmY